MGKRRDCAIKDVETLAQIEEIIRSCDVCHMAMIDGEVPYLLGFNFGYEAQTIYLHCAKEGKKIDILKKNPNVCISFDSGHKLFARNEHVACSWRMGYKSVLTYGKAELIDEYDEKMNALKTLMKNYSDKEFTFNKPAVDNIMIIRIKIDSWTGRTFEY